MWPGCDVPGLYLLKSGQEVCSKDLSETHCGAAGGNTVTHSRMAVTSGRGAEQPLHCTNVSSVNLAPRNKLASLVNFFGHL